MEFPMLEVSWLLFTVVLSVWLRARPGVLVWL
jgi:hypothetical protein